MNDGESASGDGKNRQETILSFRRWKHSGIVPLRGGNGFCNIMIPFLKHIDIQFCHIKFTVLNNHQNIVGSIITKGFIISIIALINEVTEILVFHFYIRCLNVFQTFFPVIVAHLILNVERVALQAYGLSKKWIFKESFREKLTYFVRCRQKFVALFVILGAAVL